MLLFEGGKRNGIGMLKQMVKTEPFVEGKNSVQHPRMRCCPISIHCFCVGSKRDAARPPRTPERSKRSTRHPCAMAASVAAIPANPPPTIPNVFRVLFKCVTKNETALPMIIP